MRFSLSSALCLGILCLSYHMNVCNGMPRSFSSSSSDDDGKQKKNIELGTIRPEGIDIIPNEKIGLDLGIGLGPIAIRSELFWGGVEAVNLKTGEKTQIVERAQDFFFAEEGDDKAMAIGIKYYQGYVFVCGGFGGTVRVYNIYTGDEVVSCPVAEGGFINDMTFLDGIGYITNSFDNDIATIDAEAALDGDCVTDSFPLVNFPTDFTSFNANGIVPYNNGLLIANYFLGGVYYYDFDGTGEVTAIIPEGTAVGGDGLAITSDGTKLFVCQNQFETGGFGSDTISVYELDDYDDGTISATFIKDLDNTNFDAPTTCTLTKNEKSLYFINARFATIGFPATGENDLETFSEEFNMVGLKVEGITKGN